MCDLSSLGNGELSNCTQTAVDNIGSDTDPSGITFATSNTTQYAYVPSPIFGGIFFCPLNIDYGTLDTCRQGPQSESTYSQPSAVAFATTTGGTPTQYAYFTDAATGATDGAVFQCNVNSGGGNQNGQLQNCSPTGNISTLGANGIAFATFNGVSYAYLTNFGNETVYQCSWSSSTGQLSSCVDAASFMNNAWTLKGIAFGTINGVQYAYVSDYDVSSPYNSGTVWQCTVNNNTGLFNTCTKTPATAPSPGWFVNGSVAIYPAS